MKEIQQVLISLGPLIAASVFSLSAKEKEDSIDHREPGSRHSGDPSPVGDVIISPNVLYRINGEELVHLKDLHDSDGRDGNKCLSTGFLFLNPDAGFRNGGESSTNLSQHIGPEEDPSSVSNSEHEIISSFCVKEEIAAYSMEHQDGEHLESTNSQTSFPFMHTDFGLRNKDEPAASSISHPNAEGGECSAGPTLGQTVFPEVVVVRIKEEGETCSVEQQDCEIIESVSTPAGIGSVKKQRKVRESLTRTVKAPHHQAAMLRGNTKVLKSKKARMPMWTESNWKVGGEKSVQYESGVSNTPYFTMHQGSPKPGRSDKYKERESKLRHLQFLKGLPSTQQNSRVFTCTECGKSYGLKAELIRHMIIHTGVRPYPCTECGKSFFQMPHLIRHHRTHSGEKPYACSFCHKRFNRKDNLNGHERIHTGERPYQCNDCEKRFIRKSDLNEHRRKHI